MDSNDQVRNFYEEEAEYEKTTLIIKELITKLINLRKEVLEEKIKHIDTESKYIEFFDLFDAVIGRKTDKYYVCNNEDDVKYYDLELGNIYRIEDLNPDIQSKNNEERVINLQARALLAERFIIMVKELKETFALNLGKSDGSLATIDPYIIVESDIEYLNDLIKYLETIIDKTGRLKILSAEQEVFALEKEKQDYNKKSSVEKWIYKILKKEKNKCNLHF